MRWQETPLFRFCAMPIAYLVLAVRYARPLIPYKGYEVDYDPPVRRRWLFGFFVFWLFSVLVEPP